MALTPPAERPGLPLALTAAAAGLVLPALPIFLMGGLAVQIRADLGFSETQLGAAVTATFLVGGVAGPLGGKVADRIGAAAAMVIGALLAVGSLGGMALLGRSWGTLTAFLMLSGLSFAFMDPGLAIMISRAVDRRHQGLAFGTKEASIPAATLLAGLAVPAIALVHGWRWALLIGVVPVVVLVVTLPRLALDRRPIDITRPGESPPLPPPRRAVFTVAAAAALGSTAASGIGVFLTESAVAMGFSPAAAGYLLAGGSVAGIAVRIGTGVVADRRDGPQLGLIGGMMAAGAVAMAVAAAGSTPLLVVGTVGAFAGGWGWTGLLFLSLVRASPAAPGAVAGVGLTGLALGNALGPLTFGAVAQQVSFAGAWATAAVLSGLGAILALRASRSFGATTGATPRVP